MDQLRDVAAPEPVDELRDAGASHVGLRHHRAIDALPPVDGGLPSTPDDAHEVDLQVSECEGVATFAWRLQVSVRRADYPGACERS